MSVGPPKVLVVDDDEDAVTLLGIALRRRGFQVQGARSCAEGRALLAESPADAVVVDLSLPDGSGTELIASLADRPRAVIVVSGLGSDEDRERSRAAGADAHLVKPIDVAKLAGKLSELLGAGPC